MSLDDDVRLEQRQPAEESNKDQVEQAERHVRDHARSV